MIKSKTVIEIESEFTSSELGVLPLLSLALNNDGAKISSFYQDNLNCIDSQVILFAKKHYKRGETLDEDFKILQAILGESWKIENPSFQFCSQIVFDTARIVLNSNQLVSCILDTTVDNKKTFKQSESTDKLPVYSIVHRILSELSITPVSQLGDWNKILSQKKEKWV